jgi:hypothetical protein
MVLNRKLEVFPEEVVTSEQFRSGRPPNITIPREEVEACFIGDGKTTIFQILEETAGIRAEIPRRIYDPGHYNAQRDEVILVISLSTSM